MGTRAARHSDSIQRPARRGLGGSLSARSGTVTTDSGQHGAGLGGNVVGARSGVVNAGGGLSLRAG